MDSAACTALLADRRALRQLLNNLVANGIKFTDSASLGQAIHDNPAATACLADSMFRYAAGRDFDVEAAAAAATRASVIVVVDDRRVVVLLRLAIAAAAAAGHAREVVDREDGEVVVLHGLVR